MNIVLTGSLGHISQPLAQELVQKRHSVTIVSSRPERHKEIAALGAKSAIGSIEDDVFLTKTFTGADVVYLMEPPADYTDQNLDLYAVHQKISDCYVKAVRQSGVTKIIHLSSIGAHTDKGNGLLAYHYQVENTLKQLPDDVSVKTMRPVGFFYNLLANIQVIKQTEKGFLGALLALRYYGLGGLLNNKRGVILSNIGGEAMNLLVSPVDIASVIAEEIEKPFNGRTFRYIASEELTCSEVAKILGEAIGKPYLRWGKISDKQLLNALLKTGMNEAIAKGLVEMQTGGRSGVLYEDYYRHRPVLGKTKLKDYVNEFAKAYNQN